MSSGDEEDPDTTTGVPMNVKVCPIVLVCPPMTTAGAPFAAVVGIASTVLPPMATLWAPAGAPAPAGCAPPLLGAPDPDPDPAFDEPELPFDCA